MDIDDEVDRMLEAAEQRVDETSRRLLEAVEKIRQEYRQCQWVCLAAVPVMLIAAGWTHWVWGGWTPGHLFLGLGLVQAGFFYLRYRSKIRGLDAYVREQGLDAYK